MFLRYLGRPYYDADKDAGGAGGDPEPEGGKVKASDILGRYGKNEEAALRLAELYAESQNELYRLREQRRQLRQERDDLKAKLPADGTVVLAKDEAELLEQYRALGGKPAELKAALETKGQAETELATLKRERVLGQAAEAAGFKPSVLRTLAGTLEIQVKQSSEGRPLPVVIADGKETALEDYARAAWSDFMPSLVASTTAPNINADGRGNGNHTITDEQRQAAERRYRSTF